MVFGPEEGFVFADDHAGNLVEKDGSAAHRARGEGGIKGAFAVDGRGEATGVFEGIYFPVEHGATLLDALVVATTDDFPIADDDAADGDSTFV